MPATLVALRHRRPLDYGSAPGSSTITRRGRELFRRYANLVVSALGANSDNEYALAYSSADPAFAVGGLAMSGGAGTVGVTLNGVATTATYATSDTNSCGLIAAAINASSNALVAGYVTASNLTATLTLTSTVAGDFVNICGTRFTAVSGTPPQSVSGGNLCTFDVSGNDAADATALAAAINAAPGVSRYVSALVISNVVRLFARQFAFSGTATFTWPSGPGVPANSVISGSGTIVANVASLTAAAFVGINACMPGISGNTITTVASGTGVTVLNAAARLVNGAGFAVVPVIDAA
jgi:hypothetical protein